MPKGQRDRSDSLDCLASGRLPKHVVEALDSMTMTVDEVVQWNASKPVVDVRIKNRELQIRINLSVSLGKMIAGITAAIGVLWTIIVFVTKYELLITTIISRLGL